MSTALLERVPTERRDAARAALAAALGTAAVDELEPVASGASGALTYRVAAAGRSYLLRMETRRSPLRNPHQYECMRIAAESGVAPALRHVDADAGVAVMDFVRQRPHGEYPDGPSALARDLGRLAARLQKTPAFPRLWDFPRVIERIFGFVRGSRLFADGLLEPHAEGFARVRAAYRWDESTLVSSHNDPNAQNVLFDGERLWLVDWETAYRNDPLTDVAILLENFAHTPALERTLVEAWLGNAPDRALRARLALMRQLARLYYASLLLSFAAAAPRAAPESDLTALTADEFRTALAAGQHAPTSAATLLALGKMHLAGFLAGMTAPGFDEALAIAERERKGA